MRLTLRQLQIFVSIAHTGSTTAAAEQVSLSQSAVSAAMSELERSLNTNLFDRVGKRLLLNDSGRAVLPHALALLRSAEDLEQSCLEKHPSLLRLGASLTIGNYLLPKLLADYWRLQGIQAGDVTPPMQITVANTVDIAARVENFELDIGLVEGTCHRSGVHVTPWMDDELLIVVSPRHPIAQQYGRGVVPASRLKQANWLLREPGSGTREVLEQALLPQLNQIRSTLQFSDHEAIKHACAEGLGIACLSRLAVTEMLEAGRLVNIQSEFGMLKRNFHILTHEKKQITFGMQRFIDFLRLQAEHPAHAPLEG